MTVAIVGTGRLGQAIGVGLARHRPLTLSGRQLVTKRELAGALDRVRLVIHASGPAGEAACREDPGQAFALHYTLTERLALWAGQQADRRLILLGTCAPNVGFYGPLKRAAIARATERPEAAQLGAQLTVVECGHVIGEGLSLTDHNAGVVARFVRAALAGARLQIVGGGEQTIRYTPIHTLVGVLRQLVDAKPDTKVPPVLAPVSAPVTVMEVGRTCLRLARILYGVDRAVLVEAPHRTLQLDYEAPTGKCVAVPDLSDVLVQWMRTVEAKVLLGIR